MQVNNNQNVGFGAVHIRMEKKQGMPFSKIQQVSQFLYTIDGRGRGVFENCRTTSMESLGSKETALVTGSEKGEKAVLSYLKSLKDKFPGLTVRRTTNPEATKKVEAQNEKWLHRYKPINSRKKFETEA